MGGWFGQGEDGHVVCLLQAGSRRVEMGRQDGESLSSASSEAYITPSRAHGRATPKRW